MSTKKPAIIPPLPDPRPKSKPITLKSTHGVTYTDASADFVKPQFGPLVVHQPDGSAVVLPVCSTCGWPVKPGATCEVDGTVAK